MQPRLWLEKRYAHMPDPRFLLDANMPRSSAGLLRSLGYDVEDVRDIGMKSRRDENRSLDKDG
jgi:hypothetical protein